jgi:hypothetical protein
MYLKWGLCQPSASEAALERSQVALKGRGSRPVGP